jgi:hypothetical protein
VNVLELFNFLINYGQCFGKEEAKMFQRELVKVKSSSSAMFALAMAYAAQNGNLNIKEYETKRRKSKKKKAVKKKDAASLDTTNEDPTSELKGSKLTVQGMPRT